MRNEKPQIHVDDSESEKLYHKQKLWDDWSHNHRTALRFSWKLSRKPRRRRRKLWRWRKKKEKRIDERQFLWERERKKVCLVWYLVGHRRFQVISSIVYLSLRRSFTDTCLYINGYALLWPGGTAIESHPLDCSDRKWTDEISST